GRPGAPGSSRPAPPPPRRGGGGAPPARPRPAGKKSRADHSRRRAGIQTWQRVPRRGPRIPPAGGAAGPRSRLPGGFRLIAEPHGGLREEARERRSVGLLGAQLLQLLGESGRALADPRADLLGQSLGLVQDLLAKLPLAPRRLLVQGAQFLLDTLGRFPQLAGEILNRLQPLFVLAADAFRQRLDLLADEAFQGIEPLLGLRAGVGGLLQEPLFQPRELLLEVVDLGAEEDVPDFLEVRAAFGLASGRGLLLRRRTVALLLLVGR